MTEADSLLCLASPSRIKIITNGKNPAALYEIIRGRNVGMLFVGKHL
jgi:hypothetical protein